MKKLLLFSFFFGFYLSVFAQTNVYHPFPTHDAFWGEDSFSSEVLSSNAHCSCYQVFITGDTVVGSITYHKLWASGISFYPYCSPYSCSGSNPITFSGYCGAFREDTIHKKVFYLPADSASDTLLYNYNLNLGDTLPPTYSNSCYPGNYISKVDSVLIGTKYHKCYGISGYGFQPDTNYAYLIEGVGSSWGLISHLCPLAEYASWSNLDCFSVNGITLYPDTNTHCKYYAINKYEITKNEVTVSPNPFTTSTQITFNQTYQSVALEVYDIQGKLLMQNRYAGCDHIEIRRGNLSEGLYFLKITIDGNKVETRKIVINN